MNKIRQEQIKEYIEKNNVATIKELQEMFPNVSLMTIHRDLDALESMGILAKHRGGVRAVQHFGDMEFDVRLRNNTSGKLAMARKAKSLLQPKSSVFIDTGTSTLYLAKNLPDINLNIVTTSPNIALELCRLRCSSITMCGGSLNTNNFAVSGYNTLEMLDKINIDTAFIGVSGCSLDAGFTCGTEGDSFVKRAVIKKARTSVLMCGSEKLKCLMPYTFAKMEDVDYIISDKPFPEEYVKEAQKYGVKLL